MIFHLGRLLLWIAKCWKKLQSFGRKFSTLLDLDHAPALSRSNLRLFRLTVFQKKWGDCNWSVVFCDISNFWTSPLRKPVLHWQMLPTLPYFYFTGLLIAGRFEASSISCWGRVSNWTSRRKCKSIAMHGVCASFWPMFCEIFALTAFHENLWMNKLCRNMLEPVGCNKLISRFSKIGRDADRVYSWNCIPLNPGWGKLRMRVLDVWPINLWRRGFQNVCQRGMRRCWHILLNIGPKSRRWGVGLPSLMVLYLNPSVVQSWC